MINLSHVTFLLVFNLGMQQVTFSTSKDSLNGLKKFLKDNANDNLKISKIKLYDSQKFAFKASKKERLIQCVECDTELTEMIKKLL